MNTVTISQPEMRAPWFKRWLTRVVLLALTLVIFWLAGVPNLLLQWAHYQSKPKHVEQVSTQTVTTPTAAVSVVPPQPKGNDSSISKVPLPLLLTGTMPGRNHKEGLAFIGVNKDSPQTYQVGALLANGVRIAEIYKDHVVLERNHQRVDLYLDGTGEHKVSPQLAAMLTVGGETSAPAPIKVTHRDVLTDYLRPSPVYDGDTLKGYQVYAGQQAGVFSQLGLEAGDVITAINGAPLNEPQSAIQQLQQLTEGAALTATIERRGQSQTISLDGSLIKKEQERLQNPVAPPTVMPGM
jgi:type II secretion system protein C